MAQASRLRAVVPDCETAGLYESIGLYKTYDLYNLYKTYKQVETYVLSKPVALYNLYNLGGGAG